MIGELALIVICVIAAVVSFVKECSWSWSWTSCSWSWSNSWRLAFPTLSLHDSILERVLYSFYTDKQRVLSKFVSCNRPPQDPEQESQECCELNEDDLKVLISQIDETDGGPPWKLMMEQSSIPALTYQAWYRDPPLGPTQYRTRTVFENVSPELLRDFFWDDKFRPKWDTMLIRFTILRVCRETGTMIVHWIRKLALFCSNREYIIIRRIWESESGYYCITKGTPYPSLPKSRRPRRVDVYNSSWHIRPVKPGNEDQQMASEVLLFHYEDPGLPREVVKMGVKAGMWNLVKKLHLEVQNYNMERAHDGSPSYYAIMARITTKIQALPSTTNLPHSEVDADETVWQSQNPQTQVREIS